ncbi:MAG: hypothetical protein AABZ00_17995 [Chloroflexota bacterium]
MDSPEEQLESLSKKIEEREQLARRRAWFITLIPIVFAGLFLTYTIWQIAQAELKLAQKTSELAGVENEITVLRTQLPEAQATLGAMQAVTDKLQADLSQSESALATATAQLSETQKELDAARVFAQNSCPIDEMVLKEYTSNYTPQAQALLYLIGAQLDKKVPWNPGGFSETAGFDSPNFALYVLQNAIPGFPLVSAEYQPGALPWNILQPTAAPQDGDIVYYQSGYTMFYYELPISYGAAEKMKCVIGMAPLGIISQQLGFAEYLGALKVPYP